MDFNYVKINLKWHVAPSEQSSHAWALYNMLLALDHEMDQHVDNIAAIIAQVVPTTSDKPLQMEEQWFCDTLHNIYVANPGRDKHKQFCIIMTQ